MLTKTTRGLTTQDWGEKGWRGERLLHRGLCVTNVAEATAGLVWL